LDRAMRERLMDELPAILRRAGATAITVTHDQEEAFAIADRVVLMRAGGVVQIGTPEEVYRRPASAWAAHFLGLTNLLDARTVRRGVVETALGLLELGDSGSGTWDAGREAKLLIRPEAARLDGAGPNVVQGVITERSFRGGHYRLSVRHTSGVELTFNLPANGTPIAPGESITFFLDPQALALLPTSEAAD
jgi:ABC-type Fe3+/spermidine/putrescine transport system ATPase subunit